MSKEDKKPVSAHDLITEALQIIIERLVYLEVKARFADKKWMEETIHELQHRVDILEMNIRGVK